MGSVVMTPYSFLVLDFLEWVQSVILSREWSPNSTFCGCMKVTHSFSNHAYPCPTGSWKKSSWARDGGDAWWAWQHEFLLSKADLTATDKCLTSQRRHWRWATNIEHIPGDHPDTQFQVDYIGCLPLWKWQNLLLEMALPPLIIVPQLVFSWRYPAPQHCLLECLSWLQKKWRNGTRTMGITGLTMSLA